MKMSWACNDAGIAYTYMLLLVCIIIEIAEEFSNVSNSSLKTRFVYYANGMAASESAK